MMRPPPRSPLFPYTTLFRSPPLLLPDGRRRHERALRDRAGVLGHLGQEPERAGLPVARRRRPRLGPHVRPPRRRDRKSTRLNSSHANISYAVFCLKKTVRPL